MDQLLPAPKVEQPSWTKRIKECVRKLCRAQGLNVFYATLCVIDLFGVFPIVALPGALISCGKFFYLANSFTKILKQISSFDEKNSFTKFK